MTHWQLINGNWHYGDLAIVSCERRPDKRNQFGQMVNMFGWYWLIIGQEGSELPIHKMEDCMKACELEMKERGLI